MQSFTQPYGLLDVTGNVGCMHATKFANICMYKISSYNHACMQFIAVHVMSDEGCSPKAYVYRPHLVH